MLDDIIALDKRVNHKVFGGHWNQTVSRNVGTKISRATGMSVQRGTDLFHGALVVGGVIAGGFALAALGVIGAATKR